jgi:hypothetical protein
MKLKRNTQTPSANRLQCGRCGGRYACKVKERLRAFDTLLKAKLMNDQIPFRGKSTRYHSIAYCGRANAKAISNASSTNLVTDIGYGGHTPSLVH